MSLALAAILWAGKLAIGARVMKGKILVGTASWTDPGFIADWYPPKLPATERLRWYAEHFNLVEVNSSFYRIPERRFVERWCEQTPEGFTFDVKLHRFLSRHSTKPELLPKDLRPKASLSGKKVELTPALEEAVTERFLKSLEPFEDADKLGALLLQLSPSFSPRKNSLDELNHLLTLLKGRRIAIELRNRKWVVGEHFRDTEAWFKKHKVTFVMVDTPTNPHFMIMPKIDVVTNPKLAYLRAHGRNTRGYIAGRTVAERFDYDYSEAEIQEMAQRAENIVKHADELHMVYNNNASNYAPKAAIAFQNALVKRHPEVTPNESSQRETVYA
ncbi:MAG: hypothetical protein JWQ71_4755 [Pedosphaera sp.]|nr:hypothetical protein [Pedosphaera sp.]